MIRRLKARLYSRRARKRAEQERETAQWQEWADRLRGKQPRDERGRFRR